ncbi:MAG: 3-phytase, partial [Acidobacteria bacterium]
MRVVFWPAIVGLPALGLYSLAQKAAVPILRVEPAFFTEPVGDDADDAAIWVNPRDSSRSLI